MKASFLALALLAGPLAPRFARSQALPEACTTLSGTITDGTQPLAGVTVTVQESRQMAITNSEGFFSLTLKSLTPAKLLFDAAGYEPQALTATTCQPVQLEMSVLPGTRIRQRGRHKGFIVKAGELPSAAN